MILATAPGSVTETAFTAKILQEGIAVVTAFHKDVGTSHGDGAPALSPKTIPPAYCKAISMRKKRIKQQRRSEFVNPVTLKYS